MNHREPTHPLSRLRKAFHCLSLLLLPTLAPAGLLASTRPRDLPGQPVEQQGSEPLPYLAAVGAPALRFLPAAPAPDLVTRPPAAGPPLPGLPRTEPAAAPASPGAAPPAPAHEPADSHAVEPGAEPARGKPLPILHDELRPQVRPEDFLPYFQVPGSATQSGAVIPGAYTPRGAPEPAPLPPSSATYTQTPQ